VGAPFIWLVDEARRTMAPLFRRVAIFIHELKHRVDERVWLARKEIDSFVGDGIRARCFAGG